ncbi:hypothetical protein ARMSODRAFT_1017604 [Armillaria solidipes]|uniref:Uncharacterized protein n=1 Tax=Armillaria solidipes TaxID=1076256 RepID=A0A2H3BMD7_9AGAR|nr:hypothetical protein ARMSODRAFT_1017604 [Armillaria solidipes]
MASECKLAAPSIDDQLPPKTGRTYTVIGGAELLGGRSYCSCSDAEKTRSASVYNFPFAFQSLPVLLAADYSSANECIDI